MEYITVKSQAELDAVPVDANKIIRIEFGTDDEPAVVKMKYKYTVNAHNNSTVVAYDGSRIEAHDNSSVFAFNNSSVVACNNSSVWAYGNSNIAAYDGSHVWAYGNSNIAAYDGSRIWAHDNSSVFAFNNSRVEAYDNSTVRAYNNSTVVAYGNVQITDYNTADTTIQTFGNARRVHMPINIDDYLNFYNILHDEETAVLYKAVHKINDEYFSDFDDYFKYTIGKEKCSDTFNDNPDCDCGAGINACPLHWALDFGKDWDDIAILELEVRIKDILLPKDSNGKVRVPKAKVIREVPLEECGLMGKFILKRRESNGT